MCRHYETTCPLVLVACPLFAAGACGENCSGKTSHANMRAHVESQLSVDLVLGLAARVKELTEETDSKRRTRNELFPPSSFDEEVCGASSSRAPKRGRVSMMSSSSISNGSEGEGSSTVSGGEGIVFGGARFPVKAWHASHHTDLRVICCNEITILLKMRRPHATDDWHEKLPHMVKRLEDALYHEADGLREYSDWNTLKLRLQTLALSMGGNRVQD
jgi:hypothetical protein